MVLYLLQMFYDYIGTSYSDINYLHPHTDCSNRSSVLAVKYNYSSVFKPGVHLVSNNHYRPRMYTCVSVCVYLCVCVYVCTPPRP